MEKKLIVPIIALAAVGIVGSVYTLKQSGPISASAQTATVSSPPRGDTETVGSKEAKVDAGNGQVLQTDTADGETNDGKSGE